VTKQSLTAIGELIEAELIFRFAGAAPEQAKKALGIHSARIGGGVVLSMANDPMGGFWNQNLGFGVTEPVTAQLIGEVIEFHREHGSPKARIQIAPELLPPDWDDIVAVHRLTPGGTIVKLVGAIDDLRPGSADLRIGRIADDDADAWAALAWDVFASRNEDVEAMVAAAVHTGVYEVFAAWDRDEMVGGGNLFLHGGAGKLTSDVTRESHRGRGIHSAVIAARARAAAEAGCRWLVTETETAERPGSNPSLNNMVRAGLTPLYERVDWVWQPRA
jgi:GNAT superfamily N-acetyltransferase